MSGSKSRSSRSRRKRVVKYSKIVVEEKEENIEMEIF